MHKRILVLASHAPSLTGFRGRLLEAMVGTGVDVVAVAPELDAHPDVISSLDVLGVHARSVDMARTGLDPRKDLAVLWHLMSIMRAERPDIFLGYTIKPVIWGLLAAVFTRVPARFALITGLGYAFAEGASGRTRVVQKIAQWLYRKALARAHGVIFQNSDDAALFRQMGLVGKNQAVTVVNGSGVDLEAFPPQPLAPGRSPTFLLVARLLKAKGIREYVEAARQVRKTHPDARFVLVGGADSGNPDALDIAEVERWHAQGVIDWRGELDDVRPALGEADVFVLPSYREGTPRSALEAMATGRALIVTDTAGCREVVVEGKNGFLVPVREAAGLARAMTRFLDDPSLVASMGEGSLAIARERYDVNKVNRHMLDIMGIA